jgi:hypothetical protein
MKVSDIVEDLLGDIGDVSDVIKPKNIQYIDKVTTPKDKVKIDYDRELRNKQEPKKKRDDRLIFSDVDDNKKELDMKTTDVIRADNANDTDNTEHVNEGPDKSDRLSNATPRTVIGDRYSSLGYSNPDSGRTSAEIADELRQKSASQQKQKATQARQKGKAAVRSNRIDKFAEYTTTELKKLIAFYDSDEYANGDHSGTPDFIYGELVNSEDHKDAYIEYRRRMKLDALAKKEAKAAGYTKTVRGKIVGDPVGYKKAQAGARREKKQSDRDMKQELLRKSSSGTIGKKPIKAFDASKPWNTMGLKGGRKEFRKILKNPQHPKYQEAYKLERERTESITNMTSEEIQYIGHELNVIAEGLKDENYDIKDIEHLKQVVLMNLTAGPISFNLEKVEPDEIMDVIDDVVNSGIHDPANVIRIVHDWFSDVVDV